MLFKKLIENNPEEPINSIIAMEIYSKFKDLNTDSESFVFSELNKFPFDYIVETKQEINRLENIVMTAMQSENKPQSKEELRLLLSSDLIDCDIILQDTIDYIMVFELDTTRADFIEQFTNNEGITI